MTVSDAPNCSVTYDRHYDDHNSFIIQATAFTKSKCCYSNNGLQFLKHAVPLTLWKNKLVCLKVTNTLAYYEAKLNTPIKCFMVQISGVNSNKFSFVVIH